MWDIVEYDWEGVETLLEGYELDAEMKESFEAKFYLYAVLRAVPWAQKWHARGETQTVNWLKFAIQKAKEQLGT